MPAADCLLRVTFAPASRLGQNAALLCLKLAICFINTLYCCFQVKIFPDAFRYKVLQNRISKQLLYKVRPAMDTVSLTEEVSLLTEILLVTVSR